MDRDALTALLRKYKDGLISEQDAVDTLKRLPYENLGWVRIDHHRAIRSGYPEVIFCQGKQPEQVSVIARKILALDAPGLLATRAEPRHYDAVKAVLPDASYSESAGVIYVKRRPLPEPPLPICVVTAGTSDIPVAEEAAITADVLGNRVERVYDVGVAGIHRLFDSMDIISGSGVVIVVAGMEGALASVVGGLVDKPVVAVPTSIGYGANLGGISALLSMLNSCAAGVGVVNIDNGFGAAWLAGRINRMSLE